MRERTTVRCLRFVPCAHVLATDSRLGQRFAYRDEVIEVELQNFVVRIQRIDRFGTIIPFMPDPFAHDMSVALFHVCVVVLLAATAAREANLALLGPENQVPLNELAAGI